MCGVCGCGEGEATIGGKAHHHAHDHPHSHDHGHGHELSHEHGHDHAPPQQDSRWVRVEQDILSENNAHAADNRHLFNDRGMLVLNLVSSPGSGKTTLLTRTLQELKEAFPMSVIEGDQQTPLDAERIRATGVKAVQINTGKGCHLDAHMVGHAVVDLQPESESLLFIENVGNLVCPAGFDLGEAHKVVVLSVTEGEDKPLKYPDMFHAASLMLLNKTDLLPHLDFDVEACIANARRINPGIKVLQVSAKSGDGMQTWYRWLKAVRDVVLIERPETRSETVPVTATAGG